jgi:ABC-type glycerol-3-phosphate transport system permease component
LAKRNAKALSAGEVEDPRLMRFNNTIAAMLLGGAQLAFLLGLEAVGWGLSLAVATAAGVALAVSVPTLVLFIVLQRLFVQALAGTGK